jgi:cell wall-associated NlpC family hydrolase
MTVAAIVGLAAAGCGERQASSSTPSPATAASSAADAPAPLRGHPQAIEPVAGASGSGAAGSRPGQVSVGASSGALAQPVSDAQIRQELAASGLTANAAQAQLTPSGLAIAPIDAPSPVIDVIQAGNEIAHLPYVWGGGHARYIDTGYDCSGSLSFVFAAAGLLNTTVTSGQLMSWGLPGPGKWITVFAAPGHTFMYVAGLRFDTVALAETGSRWSNRSAAEGGGFVARHPPGL